MPAGMPIRKRDHDRHRGELDRHRQLLRDQLAHRHLDAQRLAEIAGQHALDPVDVLHRHRLIEPVLLADLRDHVGIALLAGHDQRRIARQQLLQREDHHRHEEQRRDQLQQALAEEVQHGVRSCPGRTAATKCRRAEPGPMERASRSRLCGAAQEALHRVRDTRDWLTRSLTSASTRSRAPVRPASACSLRAGWYARSGCGGDRGRAAAFRRARALSAFRRSPCAAPDR